MTRGQDIVARLAGVGSGDTAGPQPGVAGGRAGAATGRTAIRDRTRARLMEQAMAMMGAGRLPSVVEVAQAAGVSRATAYRYFSTRSHLISAVVGEALGPVRSFEPSSSDGLARIRELLDETIPRFVEFEPHLRAAMMLALEHQWLERAGALSEAPFRRGHRVAILRRVAAPLRRQLGARRYDRLLKSLSLVYGIESWVVLKDIWGCEFNEVNQISRWMVEALVDRALAEAGLPRGPGEAGGKPQRAS